jgi:hypothetical protein
MPDVFVACGRASLLRRAMEMDQYACPHAPKSASNALVY